MTNAQLFISVGVPVLVLIVGFVWQNRALQDGLAGLRNEMLSKLDSLERRLDSLERRVGVIESDLRQFYSITGNHEGRISAIEKR